MVSGFLLRATAPIRKPMVGAWALVVATTAVAGLPLIAMSGRKLGIGLTLSAAFGPIALYAAIVAPIVFPFGLYVLVTPFDNLTTVGTFGSATKAFAILSVFALLLYQLRIRKTATPSRSNLWWIIVFSWMALTEMWAIDQQTGVQRLTSVVLLLLLYLVVAATPITRRELWITFALTIVGGTLAALYGVHLARNGLMMGDSGRLALVIENSNSFIDPNHYAASLITPICLSLMLILRARSWVRAVPFVLIMGVMMLGIAYAASRGSVLALATVFLYFIIRSTKKIRLFVFAGIASVPLIALSPFIISRFTKAISTGGAGRLSIWRVGLRALHEYWLLGAGYANFPFAYDKHLLEVFQPYFAQWHRVAHSLIISTAVETGIFGLLLMLGAWFAQYKMLRRIDRHDDLYDVRVALEAALVGLFICSIFLDVMSEKYIWLAFMLIALTYTASKERSEHRIKADPVLENTG